ncbi:MAG: hypothetical protein ABWY68_07870, partial [Cryobacterium sp.]
MSAVPEAPATSRRGGAPWTLRRRLVVGIAGVVAAVLVFMGVLSIVTLSASTNAVADTQLTASMSALSRSVDKFGGAPDADSSGRGSSGHDKPLVDFV